MNYWSILLVRLKQYCDLNFYVYSESVETFLTCSWKQTFDIKYLDFKSVLHGSKGLPCNTTHFPVSHNMVILERNVLRLLHHNKDGVPGSNCVLWGGCHTVSVPSLAPKSKHYVIALTCPMKIAMKKPCLDRWMGGLVAGVIDTTTEQCKVRMIWGCGYIVKKQN